MERYYIKNKKEFNDFLNRLDQKNIKEIAVDIESEQNRHCYGTHICLIQIFDGDEVFLIDALAFKNKAIIGNFLEDEKYIKIMYAAANDLSVVRNSIGHKIFPIIDLQMAEFVLDNQHTGLGNIINKRLNIAINKSSKYQKANWMKRPLNDEMLNYAVDDVLYLFKLKDVLFNELNKNNLYDEFINRNIKIQNKDYLINQDKRYLKVKKINQLNRNEKLLFKEFYLLRDKIAKTLNKSPNNIITNEKLIFYAKEFKLDKRELFENIKEKFKFLSWENY